MLPQKAQGHTGDFYIINPKGNMIKLSFHRKFYPEKFYFYVFSDYEFCGREMGEAGRNWEMGEEYDQNISYEILKE